MDSADRIVAQDEIVAWTGAHPDGLLRQLVAFLRAARSAGGARWRGERLPTAPPPVRPASDDAVSRLRQLYLEADFLGCLAATQDPELDIDALLGRRLVDHAARAGVFCRGLRARGG